MRQTLEDLYNGKIAPYEQKHVKSEKYLQVVQRLAEAEERILASLDDEELLEDYQDAQADATAERDLENFIYGFRLCARLIFEALDKENQ